MRIPILLFFLLIATISTAQRPSDCTEAILVCGSTQLGLEPTGLGFDEFSLPGNTVPPCQPFATNTLWLRFTIIQDGAFAFTITPENPEADYDFAIYGPNVTCTTLGEAIRCSSTNPQNAGVSAATGLNFTETDFFEGPGADGNGFLQFIDALAGEEYIMIIDRPHGSDGFSIEMTGDDILPEQPTAFPVEDISVCEMDNDVNGFTSFNLDELIPEILQGQTDVVVTFHQSIDNASVGINPLPGVYTNTSNPQELFYRVERPTSMCFDINSFEVEVTANFSISLPQDLIVCNNPNDTVVLTTEGGFAYYEWSTGEEGPALNEIEISVGGTYSVIVTDKFGCKVIAETTVTGSDGPTSIQIEVNDLSFTENSITIFVEGPGDYEFALDNPIFFQDSNVFLNPSYGVHTVFVRDKNGCGMLSKNVLIFDYPRVLTPNQDGFHDTWHLAGIEAFPNSRIYIYDRYGKLLKELSPFSEGWDGTFNGSLLPSSDYWFRMVLDDGSVIKGHFTLKR